MENGTPGTRDPGGSGCSTRHSWGPHTHPVGCEPGAAPRYGPRCQRVIGEQPQAHSPQGTGGRAAGTAAGAPSSSRRPGTAPSRRTCGVTAQVSTAPRPPPRTRASTAPRPASPGTTRPPLRCRVNRVCFEENLPPVRTPPKRHSPSPEAICADPWDRQAVRGSRDTDSGVSISRLTDPSFYGHDEELETYTATLDRSFCTSLDFLISSLQSASSFPQKGWLQGKDGTPGRSSQGTRSTDPLWHLVQRCPGDQRAVSLRVPQQVTLMGSFTSTGRMAACPFHAPPRLCRRGRGAGGRWIPGTPQGKESGAPDGGTS